LSDLEIFQFPPSGLPGKTKYGGYVYVVEFDSGLIKVGRTEFPRSRIAMYATHAAAFGVRPTRGWLSPMHEDPRPTEAALIAASVDLGGTPVGREYFNDLAFEEIATRAASLHYPPVDVRAAEARADRFAQGVVALHGWMRSKAESARGDLDHPQAVASRRFFAEEVEAVAYLLAAADRVHGLPVGEHPEARHLDAASAALSLIEGSMVCREEWEVRQAGRRVHYSSEAAARVAVAADPDSELFRREVLIGSWREEAVDDLPSEAA
jgi:hypothetical protein